MEANGCFRPSLAQFLICSNSESYSLLLEPFLFEPLEETNEDEESMDSNPSKKEKVEETKKTDRKTTAVHKHSIERFDVNNLANSESLESVSNSPSKISA